MASHIDRIPSSGLKPGDVITLQTSGTYVIPARLGLDVLVCAPPGGDGQGYLYAVSQGGHSTVGTVPGGVGGKGGQVSMSRVYEAGTTLVVEVGAKGADATPNPYQLGIYDPISSMTGKNGTAGGNTKLTVNGSPVATCTGGGGGTGAQISIGGNFLYLNYGYSGKPGANGAVTLKPADAVTGVSSATQGQVVLTVTSTNSPPTAPTPITYGTLTAGSPCDVTWGASSDIDGDPITYQLEYRTGTSAWVTCGVTSALTLSYTLPGTGATGQFRVKALDDKGNESNYTVGASKPIEYNHNPVITGATGDLGNLEHAPDLGYSIDDADAGDVLKLVISLDDVPIMTVNNAVRGTKYEPTAAAIADLWLTLPTGKHRINAEGWDDYNGYTKVTATFTRVCNILEVETVNGFLTNEIVQTIMPFFNGSMPKNADCELEVRNDPAAPWEDVTVFNYSNQIYTFKNTTCTTGGQARFDARCKVTLAASGGKAYFYGATFLLNARPGSGGGISGPVDASDVVIQSGDLLAGGALPTNTSNVLAALNKLSLAVAQGTGGGGSGGGNVDRRVVQGLTLTVDGWTQNATTQLWEHWVTDPLVTPGTSIVPGYDHEDYEAIAALVSMKSGNGKYCAIVTEKPETALRFDVAFFDAAEPSESGNQTPTSSGIRIMKNVTFNAGAWTPDNGEWIQTRTVADVTDDTIILALVKRESRAAISGEFDCDTTTGGYSVRCANKPTADVTANVVLLKGEVF